MLHHYAKHAFMAVAYPVTAVVFIRRPWILDSYLYIHIVGSVMCLFSLMWIAAPGDLWGVGAWLHRVFGVGAPDPSDHSGYALLSSAYSMGFLLSTNTIVAHELVHRTSDRLAMF